MVIISTTQIHDSNLTIYHRSRLGALDVIAPKNPFTFIHRSTKSPPSHLSKFLPLHFFLKNNRKTLENPPLSPTLSQMWAQKKESKLKVLSASSCPSSVRLPKQPTMAPKAVKNPFSTELVRKHLHFSSNIGWKSCICISISYVVARAWTLDKRACINLQKCNKISQRWKSHSSRSIFSNSEFLSLLQPRISKVTSSGCFSLFENCAISNTSRRFSNHCNSNCVSWIVMCYNLQSITRAPVTIVSSSPV